MKKVFGLVLALLLVPSLVFGASACLSTDLLTADAAVADAKKLCGVVIITDETNDATVEIHDGASVAGVTRYKTVVEGADWHGGALFPIPIALTGGAGLYVNITVAAGTMEYIIYYQP